MQSNSLLCPRESTSLVRLNDPFSQKILVLARCQTCNGFWLNRVRFARYQQYRQARQALSKPPEVLIEDNKFEQDLLKVIQEYKLEDSSEAFREAGAFLSIQWIVLPGGLLNRRRYRQKKKAPLTWFDDCCVVDFYDTLSVYRFYMCIQVMLRRI
jgi:hypothetical protein